MTGIAPDVRLSEPLDDGQRWILENAHGEKIGVSADVATFITAMQDSTDLYEVNRRFGKDNVRKVIDSSIRIPCVPQRGTETGTQGCACLFPKRQTDGGIPASIQFTLLRNPSRIFTPIRSFPTVSVMVNCHQPHHHN